MGVSYLNIKLIADLTQFSTSMQNAQRQMKQVSKSMEAVGKSMTMYLTAPIMALGAVSLKAYSDSIEAEQKLATQLKANGKNVDEILPKYKAFADQIQKTTVIEDDQVIALLQLAETMQAVDPQKAVEGAIGLSRALGIDLDSALKMVIKGQNGQFTALQKVVPALKNAATEAEKAAIFEKLLADGMSIANEEALVGMGPLMQLKNIWGNFSEVIGELISKALVPLVKWLKDAANWLNDLSPAAKETIVWAIGLAAAIGPLALGIGKVVAIGSTMISFFTTAGSAAKFFASAGGIGLILTALSALVVGLIYASKQVGGFSNLFQLVGKYAIAGIKTAWEYIKAFGIFLFEFGKLAVKLLTAPFRIMADTAVSIFTALPSAMKAAFTGDFKEAGKILGNAIKDPLLAEFDAIKEQFKSLGDPFINATKNVKGYWSEVEKAKASMTKLSEETKKVGKSLGLTAGAEVGAGAGAGSGGATGTKRDEIFIEKVDIINKDIENIQEEIKPVKISVEWDSEKLQKMEEELKRFNEEFTRLVSGAVVSGMLMMSDAIAGIVTGEIGLAGFFNSILSMIADFIGKFGEMLITMGIASEAFQALIASAFTNPLSAVLAIAAGTALVIAAGVAKKFLSKGPAYANGTLSASGGMSLVGEYGPELVNIPRGSQVIPNRSLPYMNNSPQQLVVVGKISGNDIRLSNERSTSKYNRI